MSIITSTKAAGGSIIARGSIPNASVAGTETLLTLRWSPRSTPATTVIIPIGESWMLTDLYVLNSAGAGTDLEAAIEIKKDEDRTLDYSEYLDAVLVDSNQRPNGLHGFLNFEGASQMTMTSISTEIAGAARTIKAIVPYEKTG